MAAKDYYRILGVGNMGQTGRGDFYVQIGVSVPDQLTAEQRALLQDLAEKGL